MVLLFIFLASTMLPSIPITKAQSSDTIIIQTDGTIQGTDKIQKNNNIYTLTSDITCSTEIAEALIFILKDNIILDGNSHTISSEGNGIGIHLSNRQNVTIKNLIINNFGTGISFGFAKEYPIKEIQRQLAQNNQILNNEITSYYGCIELANANKTTISDNILTTNPKYGISLGNCNFTIFVNNKLHGGSLDLGISTQNQLLDNILNGKPLAFFYQESNIVIEDANQVILEECSNITVKNIDPTTDLKIAIQLINTNNSIITNCKGRITLSNSHYNIISKNDLREISSDYFSQPAISLTLSVFNSIYENQITECDSEGIKLVGSNFNNIYKNLVSDCNSGIWLLGSNNNNVYQNILESNQFGIKLAYEHFAMVKPVCYYNSIFENIIESCSQGIHLYSAYENKIFRNNISYPRGHAVYLCCSDDNRFYSNNFLENKKQVYEEHAVYSRILGDYEYYFSENNTWNVGPSDGGNYWIDYEGFDQDGDGIGDSKYLVFENMTDYYPMVDPLDIPTIFIPTPTPTPTPEPEPFPTTLIIASIATIAVIGMGILVYFKKHSGRS